MNDESSIPADRLATLADPELQRLAARMAQDGFARIFRLTVEGDAAQVAVVAADLALQSRQWSQAALGDDARALRLALLVSGLDQWGLAYCQAFNLTAVPGLTVLLGTIRNGLDAAAEARFQQQFAAISRAETDAIDFKMELRRNIHLALWHAMIACEERDEALPILGGLASLLLALMDQMPRLGGHLVADSLAQIQIRCLGETGATGQSLAASGLGQETTQELFDVLRQALSAERFEPILARANQAVIAWQQARRWAH